ncbi:hypothetical protein Cgig2_019609 [Carnegiea gigantea]|uniref:Kinesin motor domain-containing protein n=1 Tax=Carnegiea gigantea TaxID=171969 RepID=A0A9Q1KJ37_9CARY|nr:hypothetical protein Cgig2_019609 [Carnegiea gigantea]
MGCADGEEAMPGPSGRGEERILVSVRMRPLNKKEASRNEVVDWECINNTTIVYKNHLSPERSLYPTSYTFEYLVVIARRGRSMRKEPEQLFFLLLVASTVSTSSQCFMRLLSLWLHVLHSCKTSFAASVFAYGQTSSGKTYTMSGITEYTMEDIFDYINKHEEREFHLRFSAMEIYNESVRDLLTADNAPLRLLDDPERGTVVEKLTEANLRDRDHFKELIAVCQAQRQIGETFLNEASSRSHQILRLVCFFSNIKTIESSTREFLVANSSSTLTATLNFVDLAGSERASQALSAGSRLKEGSHINRSLLTLGTVIRKLSKGGIGHIPYRDSKLTRILQPSLGGNARTAVICTMSPAQSYVEQSRNTLLFATCAKEVTTNAHVNEVMSEKALVKHLQRELARLENQLRNASPSVRVDTTNLLREKDLKIEELEGRIRELTLQLDHALSQICDLRKQERNNSSYPTLRVQQTSESSSSDTTTTADQQSFDAHSPTCETPHSSERHSRSSYDGSYSISDFEENLPPDSPFEQMIVETSSGVSSPLLIQAPKIAGRDSDCYQVPKRLGDQSANPLEVDPYAVPMEISNQSLNSYDIGPHQVSKSFQMPVQHTSNVHGAQSPYFVEFDPYELPEEMGDQNNDPSEVYAIQISRGSIENIPEYDNNDPYLTAELNRKQTDEPLEDYCKEVQCINSEMTSNIRANSLPHEEGAKSLLLMSHDSDSCSDDKPTKESVGCRDDEPKKESAPDDKNSSSQDPRDLSDKQHKEEVTGLGDLNHVGSRSTQSNDISSTSSSFFEMVKYEMKNESEDGWDEVVVRLDDAHKQLSDANNEVPKISAGMIEFDGIPVKDVEISNHVDNAVNFTRVTETKEITDPQHMKHLPNHEGEVTMHEAGKSIKSMKDVGLNPQDDLDASSLWPSNFNRLQMEILDLWDACNVSLVHRTRFFLLFVKGDQIDAIYMEVERRRLYFINDAFSSGNSIVLHGQKLTPGSSKRSIRSEREMLGRLIKKRLSKQERIDLYSKWRINLASKRRSSQVAHCLWTNKIDMDHITESANVVAKLVQFSEPQVPKEAFGLNLMTDQRRRNSYR